MKRSFCIRTLAVIGAIALAPAALVAARKVRDEMKKNGELKKTA